MYDGIINVYKEKGFTSHDVVAKMRGILGQRKVFFRCAQEKARSSAIC